MATYVNDLRLKEIATGDEAGTWGASTNTNLELIAEAFSYGTEASFGSDADATTTIADGSTDPARSLYLKVTSGASLTATRTLTIAPNTVSKVWIIENATSGSQSINISQGSGANVTIPSGKTKIVYSDGAGSGAAVVDALASLNLETSGIIETSSSIQTPLIEYTDGDDAMTIADGGQVTFAQNIIGTLGTAAQPNITSLGTLTTLTVDDITINGSTISDAGDLTLDVGGDIYLDSDNTNWRFNDGGTAILHISKPTGAVRLQSSVADADIIFGGIDGSTVIDALTLDMSDAGTAIFNHDIKLPDSGQAIFGADSDLSIYHDNSTGNIVNNTGVLNITNNDIRFKTSGAETMLRAIANGAVKLMYNNDTKLETTNGGVDISGTLTTSGLLTVNDGAIFNEGSEDKDFRVESNNNAHMLFVDGGNDHVNIGTSTDHGGVLNIETPGQGVNLVLACTDTDANEGPILDFTRDAGNVPSDNDIMGKIRFRNDDTGLTMTNYAEITSVVADVSNGTEDGQLQFNIMDNGSLKNFAHMTGGSGVVINEDSQDINFRVESNGNAYMLMVNGGNDTVGIGNNPYTTSADLNLLGDGLAIKNDKAGSNNNWSLIQNTATSGASNIKFTLGTGSIELGHGGEIITNTVAGYHTVFNQGGVDSDFRIESNGVQYMFYLDGGNDRIGINQNSPQATLDVDGNVIFGSGNRFTTSANVFKSTASGENGVQLRSAVSTAGNPSFSNVDDQGTGMFLPGSQVVGFTAGSVEKVRISDC